MENKKDEGKKFKGSNTERELYLLYQHGMFSPNTPPKEAYALSPLFSEELTWKAFKIGYYPFRKRLVLGEEVQRTRGRAPPLGKFSSCCDAS